MRTLLVSLGICLFSVSVAVHSIAPQPIAGYAAGSAVVGFLIAILGAFDSGY